MGKVTRRDFIVKGGKYTLFTGAAMQVLFTSKRAMAQSGHGQAHFVINVEGHTARVGHTTSPNRFLNGSGAGIGSLTHSVGINGQFIPSTTEQGTTWTGSTSHVKYERYHIGFTGDTAHLPANVSVTVTWTWSGGSSHGFFYWGTSSYSNHQETFSVPKGGGSVGNGGTIKNIDQRPDVEDTQQEGLSGTVTFTANNANVPPLTINITMTGGT